MHFSSLQAQEVALTIIHANTERWLSLVLCVCVLGMKLYVCLFVYTYFRSTYTAEKQVLSPLRSQLRLCLCVCVCVYHLQT